MTRETLLSRRRVTLYLSYKTPNRATRASVLVLASPWPNETQIRARHGIRALDTPRKLSSLHFNDLVNTCSIYRTTRTQRCWLVVLSATSLESRRFARFIGELRTTVVF